MHHYRLACLRLLAARAALHTSSDPIAAWFALREAETEARIALLAVAYEGAFDEATTPAE